MLPNNRQIAAKPNTLSPICPIGPICRTGNSLPNFPASKPRQTRIKAPSLVPNRPQTHRKEVGYGR
jgi:hypothetical protein